MGSSVRSQNYVFRVFYLSSFLEVFRFILLFYLLGLLTIEVPHPSSDILGLHTSRVRLTRHRRLEQKYKEYVTSFAIPSVKLGFSLIDIEITVIKITTKRLIFFMYQNFCNPQTNTH